MSIFPQRAVAAEIFSSAVCNLNCRYCYIPKVKPMTALHKDIVAAIKDGTYIKELRRLYGDNLEYLSFWGAEPTMSLNEVSGVLPLYFNAFPKLKNISFSTNFLLKMDIIKNFIMALPNDRRINLNIQISIDGPEEITGYNRMKGAAAKIVKNIKELLLWLNDSEISDKHTISFSYKPTITRKNMLWIKDHTYDYVKFFDDIDSEIVSIKPKNIILPTGSGVLTLEVPGQYTSADGKIFAEIVKKLNDITYSNDFSVYKGYLTAYHYRLERLLKYGVELFSKPSMFTCSGGDSNFGVGNGRVYMCHRGMFLSDNRYVEAIKSMEDNYDWALVKNGSVDRFRKFYSPKIDDAEGVVRFLYTMYARHGSSRARLSSTISILNELVDSGQALKKYKTRGKVRLIHIFLTTAFDCPAESVYRTASVNTANISIIRIMANGAFEYIKEEVWKKHTSKRTKN